MIKIERFLNIQLGEEAPSFSARTLDGKEIKLSDLRGKVVLLDFWATWCAPCLAEMPNIRRALDEFGKDGQFVVLGISLDEDPEVVRSVARKWEMSWKQVVLGPAEGNPLAKLYNVSSIPATFLIGRDGKVAGKDLRGRRLDSELRKLFPLVAGN